MGINDNLLMLSLSTKCTAALLNNNIRPVSLAGYGSIAHHGEAEWAIDPWPLRAKGLIVLVSPNSSDRKGDNKASQCKLKKYFFGNKTKESVMLFATRGLLLIVL